MIRFNLLPMNTQHSFKVFGLVITTAILLAQPDLRAEPVAFKLQANDVIALTGGSNIERTRFNGFLQTHLFTAQPDAKIKVRNFGWEGDTVFEQWRDGGAAGKLDPSQSWRQQRDWRQQLAEVGATAVIAQFGQMESLAGVERLPAFIAAYEKLIAEFTEGGRRVVLVSPLRFEKSMLPLAPDLTRKNTAVQAYADAIRDLAARLGVTFIDLTKFPPDARPLTENGYQLNEQGHRVVAAHIAKSLGISTKSEADTEGVRSAVIEMERLWFDYWRPMNWAFFTGDRTTVAFARDWKDKNKLIFPEEMKDFEPLLQQADENIWKALAGEPVKSIDSHSSIPVEPTSVKPQLPEEELASLNVLDGFQVNLFASEADGVVKPSQMRWDERGRLWVACTVSYPQIKPGEKANDYVLVCEDTDGDGRADKFTKFVEGLFMPTGIELGDGGLYVAQGTELLHFRDADGDGKADTRRIVLGGFGTGDSHQLINCLNWGFGGELWFTQGHHIYSRVETPYGVETLNRSGVWRLRPRTGHLDPFFQWSTAGANCWGVVTTDYGQPFHKSGADLGAFFSTPGLVRSTLAMSSGSLRVCNASAKQVGMEFIGSSQFPQEMQGRVILGGFYANRLEQHELHFENGVYSSTQLPSIIETKNNVFRPVEVRSGPDGALYVADWYNPIIGHYSASYRHPDRDKEHGRIWRVTYQDRPLVKSASLANATVSDLLEQLDSPERWTSYQAKRLLFERETKEVTTALDAWVAKLKAGDAKDEYRRLQALAIYEAHETARPELLKSLLRSPDARIRAYATRTLSTWARDGALPEAITLLEPQMADEDPLVRLEAIVAASYVPDPRAAVVAGRALDKTFNAYHQHALPKTLNVLAPLWFPALAAGKLNFDKDEHLIFALQNAKVENNPDDLKNLAGVPATYKPKSGSEQVRDIMRQQIERHAGDAARQSLWLKALATVASATDIPLILERGGEDPAVLAALASSSALRGSKPSDIASLIEPLFTATNAAVRTQAVRIAGAWKLAVFAERIRALAAAEATPLPLRKAALTAIGDFGGPADPTLLRVIDSATSPELQATALDALIAGSPDEAARIVLGKLNHAKRSEEATPLLKAMLARAEGSAAFIQTVSKPKALSPASAKLTLAALNLLGHSDRKLPQLLMKLAGMNTTLPVYTKEYVAGIVKAAQTIGRSAEGKKVFEQTGCIACHMPGAPQSQIGPDLSAISRSMPIDMIIGETIWPALNVKEGYEAATVTMKDGSVIAGFKHTETTDTIAIRDLATGSVKTLQRASTAKIQTSGTLMPDGLTATLSEQQLADLIRYLSELGK
jgi:putative heme-binding domain-containing protein